MDNINNSPLIIPDFNEGIILDSENGVLLSYDLTTDNEINYTTEGKLMEVCSEMAGKIESHYGISVSDYGVEIKDVDYGDLGDIIA